MRRLALVPLLFLLACTTNGTSGDKQLLLLSRENEIRLGEQAYQEALAEAKICYDPAYVEPVKRVAARLAEEMEKGWTEKIPPPGYDWEVHVLDAPKVAGAWALPGGKIAVCTGVFPAAHDEDGLAIVIGHEMMHAVLRHGNERVSRDMTAGSGITVLPMMIGERDDEKQKRIHTLLGMGATFAYRLPYETKMESRADEFGLHLSARSGYNPKAAVRVWKKMKGLHAGVQVKYLSTHPDHGTRIADMKRWMPQAMQYYRRAGKQPGNILPIPTDAEEHDPPPVPEVSIEPFAAQRGPVLEKEKKTQAPYIALEFQLSRAVYVDTVEISGPEGVTTSFEAKAGVAGGVPRAVTIRQQNPTDPPLPAGAYRVVFTGEVNGLPWTGEAAYEVE
ncbi:MAG: M48 family metallopeptidase [Planctomycetota bacterium]|jgi:Zn-dependent protease with chaperone function